MLVVLAMTMLLLGHAAATSRDIVAHQYRWMVSEEEPGVVLPPWTLAWAHRPIWFENWNPAGSSESPSRRAALVGDQLVTVMRKHLHALDPSTGTTRWTLRLDGDEIFDWKVVGQMLVYSSVDYSGDAVGLRGAVDLEQRTHAWRHRGNQSRLFDAEDIIVGSSTDVIFVAGTGIGDTANHLVAVDPATGRTRWVLGTDTARSTDMRLQRFTFGGRLYSFVAGAARAGLALRAFSLAHGAEVSTVHMLGTERLGNPLIPTAVRNDGTVFAVYPARLPREELRRRGDLGATDTVFAYSIPAGKLLWSTQVLRGDEPGYNWVKALALSPQSDGFLLATIWPDAYTLLDPATGAIRKRGRISGYLGWSDVAAVLYSHPYVFAGARRGEGTRMAYDLVALDVDTDTVAWQFGLETQDRIVSYSRAELLNFIVSGPSVFLSRADGMLMRFERVARQPVGK